MRICRINIMLILDILWTTQDVFFWQTSEIISEIIGHMSIISGIAIWCGYSNNKPPIFDGLYHPSMVIWGMDYYCYTNTTFYYDLSCYFIEDFPSSASANQLWSWEPSSQFSAEWLDFEPCAPPASAARAAASPKTHRPWSPWSPWRLQSVQWTQSGFKQRTS